MKKTKIPINDSLSTFANIHSLDNKLGVLQL